MKVGPCQEVPSFLSALNLTTYNPRIVTTNMLRPKQFSTLYYTTGNNTAEHIVYINIFRDGGEGTYPSE